MRQTITMVYLGLHHDHKNHKLYQRVAEVDLDTQPNNGNPLDWQENKERWYEAVRKPVLPAWTTPGSVFSTEVDKMEDGKCPIFVNTVKALGQWANKEQVAQWQMLSRARRQDFEAQSEARQSVSKRRDLEALDPIREAYLAASSIQRPFILANAISYITRGATTKRED